MARGSMTALAAHNLRHDLETRGIEVLCAHGLSPADAERLGAMAPLAKPRTITPWFGDKYDSGTRLGSVDIAIISKNSDKVLLLAEVEETTSTPKVLLSDIVATLIGTRFKFGGTRDLNVGPWTKLIALVKISNANQISRINFLEERLEQLMPHLRATGTGPTDSIGGFSIDPFSNQIDLENQIRNQIEAQSVGAEKVKE